MQFSTIALSLTTLALKVVAETSEVTTTIEATIVDTITSCGPEVTSCPGRVSSSAPINTPAVNSSSVAPVPPSNGTSVVPIEGAANGNNNGIITGAVCAFIFALVGI